MNRFQAAAGRRRPFDKRLMEHNNGSPGKNYADSPNGRPQYHEMQPAPFPSGHQRNPNHLSVQTEGQFRVSDWQCPYDSGVHSLQHSQAASMMSMNGGASHMSVVSVADTAELTDQQRQKFENIPLSFHAAPPEAASAAIPALIELISDEDEAVAVRALGIIQNTARMDADTQQFQRPIIHQPEAVTAIIELLEERKNQPNIIRVALGALFHISIRREGAHLVFSTNEQMGGALVLRLIEIIRFRDWPINVQKWAIPLLHTLLSDSQRSETNVRIARESGALDAMLYRLNKEVTDKLLSIIVQIISILCTKNEQQAKLFISNKGPHRLVFILANCSYEGLLYGTSRLLNKLSSHSLELVAVDAPLFLSRALSHASPRLVDISLECLRNLSHVRTMKHQKEILEKVIQLLGTNRIKVVQHCVDILTNMCAESQPNKELICRARTPLYLMEVLGGRHAFGDVDGKKIEDLQETILCLLRSLCHDHQFALEVQMAVMQQWLVLLQILHQMRPKLLKRTLHLLNKLAANDHNLQIFCEAKLQKDKYSFIGFPHQIVHILRVAANNLTKGHVDSVRVVDLMMQSMTLLKQISRHQAILEQIAVQFMVPENMAIGAETVFLPVFVLRQNYPNDQDEKQLKTDAMWLLASTASHPQVAAMFARSPLLMNGLQQLRKHENPEFVHLAERAYNSIMMATGQQNHQQYPPLRCAPASTQDHRIPPQRPSSPTEDEWPEDLSNLTVADPFVKVFCPTTAAPQNTPPFSPHLNPSSVPQQHSAPPQYDAQMPSWQDSSQYYHHHPPPPSQQYPAPYQQSYYNQHQGQYPTTPYNGYDPYSYPPPP